MNSFLGYLFPLTFEYYPVYRGCYYCRHKNATLSKELADWAKQQVHKENLRIIITDSAGKTGESFKNKTAVLDQEQNLRFEQQRKFH